MLSGMVLAWLGNSLNWSPIGDVTTTVLLYRAPSRGPYARSVHSHIPPMLVLILNYKYKSIIPNINISTNYKHKDHHTYGY